ncbi:MAG TPA: hypothetical protein VKR06_34505 [Ktedonosporobacter sp.]|nr:hypothetical protein [Ktedonosporobacter sp.]
MFDRLWEEDPVMKNWRQGGVEEGEIKRARWDVLRIVQMRFPGILQQVQERVELVSDLSQLGELFDQFVVASDEAAALAALDRPVEP